MRILTILLFSCLGINLVYADTLIEVIQHTLETNPDVRMSTSDRRIADHTLEQAQAGYFPTIDLTGGYGREWSDNPSTRIRQFETSEVELNRQELGITLSQRLFDGFEVKHQVAGEQAKQEASIYQVQNIAENIGLKVTEVYLEVLHREDLLELAKSNLVVHQKILKQIRTIVEGGAGRKADLEQSESRLALAKATLVKAEGNKRDAAANYQRVTGKLPDTLDTLGRELVIQALQLPDTLTAVLQTALTDHPSLRMSTADLKAAKAYRQQADASFMPRLNLELNASDNNNLDGIEGTNDDVSAMLRMRYNLYRGGADQAHRRETAERVTRATEAFLRAQRIVEETVHLSWNSLVTARERLQYLRDYVESTEHVLVSYKEQFKLGRRSLLDVLDSENELFNARSVLTTAQYTELLALFRVVASMGLLLERLGIPLPKEAVSRQ